MAMKWLPSRETAKLAGRLASFASATGCWQRSVSLTEQQPDAELVSPALVVLLDEDITVIADGIASTHVVQCLQRELRGRFRERIWALSVVPATSA